MEPSARQSLTFPALDTLRFVGSLAVVLTHVSFQTGAYGPSLLGTFVARLDVGVALFFALSGFLLSRPYFSHLARQVPMPRPGYYLWKRALRIVPVYLISVVAVLWLIPEAHGPFGTQWVRNLTMTVIYSDRPLPAGLTQMWSLATEVAFYLVLPLLMLVIAWLCCRGGRWRPDRMAVVLVVLASTSTVWLARIDLTSNRPLWLPAFLSWFCLGMAVALSSVELERAAPRPWVAFVARLGALPNTCFIAAGTLLIVASTPLAGPTFGAVPTHGQAVTKNLLYAAIAFFVIIPGVFADQNCRSIRAMSMSAPRYLGRISYGIFCLHLFVLYFTFKLTGINYFDGHFLLILVTTMAGTLALAASIYRFVERPVNRLKSVGRPKTEPAISPNASAIAN